ncbi:MAG: hypothetical protein KDB11_29955 [Planctomycetales bacterium]|nr:hypothetical protein [Planctomycetales bacterium]
MANKCWRAIFKGCFGVSEADFNDVCLGDDPFTFGLEREESQSLLVEELAFLKSLEHPRLRNTIIREFARVAQREQGRHRLPFELDGGPIVWDMNFSLLKSTVCDETEANETTRLHVSEPQDQTVSLQRSLESVEADSLYDLRILASALSLSSPRFAFSPLTDFTVLASELCRRQFMSSIESDLPRLHELQRKIGERLEQDGNKWHALPYVDRVASILLSADEDDWLLDHGDELRILTWHLEVANERAAVRSIGSPMLMITSLVNAIKELREVVATFVKWREFNKFDDNEPELVRDAVVLNAQYAYADIQVLLTSNIDRWIYPRLGVAPDSWTTRLEMTLSPMMQQLNFFTEPNVGQLASLAAALSPFLDDLSALRFDSVPSPTEDENSVSLRLGPPEVVGSNPVLPPEIESIEFVGRGESIDDHAGFDFAGTETHGFDVPDVATMDTQALLDWIDRNGGWRGQERPLIEVDAKWCRDPSKTAADVVLAFKKGAKEGTKEERSQTTVASLTRARTVLRAAVTRKLKSMQKRNF